jgi:hypothetical protein
MLAEDRFAGTNKLLMESGRKPVIFDKGEAEAGEKPAKRSSRKSLMNWYLSSPPAGSGCVPQPEPVHGARTPRELAAEDGCATLAGQCQATPPAGFCGQFLF